MFNDGGSVAEVIQVTLAIAKYDANWYNDVSQILVLVTATCCKEQVGFWMEFVVQDPTLLKESPCKRDADQMSPSLKLAARGPHSARDLL